MKTKLCPKCSKGLLKPIKDEKDALECNSCGFVQLGTPATPVTGKKPVPPILTQPKLDPNHLVEGVATIAIEVSKMLEVCQYHGDIDDHSITYPGGIMTIWARKGNLAKQVGISHATYLVKRELLAQTARNVVDDLVGKLGQVNFVYVDTETGGLDPDGHAILSVAAFVMNSDGVVVGKLYDECRPTFAVEDGALAVNGFSREDLHKKPLTEAEMVVRFWDFIETSCGPNWLWVGQNPSFDFRFLTSKGRCTGKWAEVDNIPMVDTKESIKRIKARHATINGTQSQSNSLGTFVKDYPQVDARAKEWLEFIWGKEAAMKTSHDARYDVCACIAVQEMDSIEMKRVVK